MAVSDPIILGNAGTTATFSLEAGDSLVGGTGTDVLQLSSGEDTGTIEFFDSITGLFAVAGTGDGTVSSSGVRLPSLVNGTVLAAGDVN